MSAIWGFDQIENKDTLCHRKNYMQKYCESLREQAKNIIDFEKKKNVTVNKRRIKMALRFKSLLHLSEKNLKKAL